ncbi:MAG: hypothetical protein HYU39_00505 [Thaumarchaeota archaeon]|nr:hypothetical protein [Nitrososphaerota archaeon]
MAMMFPSFGEKKQKMQVYTIEECQNCHDKVKRPFQQGDYVYKEAGECQKCHGKKMITMVFGEEPQGKQQQAKSEQKAPPQSKQ